MKPNWICKSEDCSSPIPHIEVRNGRNWNQKEETQSQEDSVKSGANARCFCAVRAFAMLLLLLDKRKEYGVGGANVNDKTVIPSYVRINQLVQKLKWRTDAMLIT
jgi:hypothetical protein